MQKLKTLDLFAGIGGFSLGLERTGGFETAAFCEIDKKAQLVLRKHWPNVPIFEDVSELSKEKLDAEGINIDVITGGFPCQDISLAGKGAGLEGERSGLWFQFHRLIQEIHPRYAIIENVAALRSRGLDVVLSGLAEIGYDAEWHCIPASAVGAPHRRDRIWITAYRNSDNQGQPTVAVNDEAPRLSGDGDVAYSDNQHRWGECNIGISAERDAWDEFSGSGKTVAHPSRELPYRGGASAEQTGRRELADGGADVANADQPRLEGWLRGVLQERAGELPAGAGGTRWVGETWFTEPDVGRVAHGIPNRVDRLKQLGNAVVPQIPQLLGHAILAREGIAS